MMNMSVFCYLCIVSTLLFDGPPKTQLCRKKNWVCDQGKPWTSAVRQNHVIISLAKHGLPSSKQPHNSGESPSLVGKRVVSIAILSSVFDTTRG